MKVLVTGANGFIGSNLCKSLIQSNQIVIGLVRDSSDLTFLKDLPNLKIIKGDVPSSKVYEDDDVLAFLDIFPVSKGHTVVAPKYHCLNLLDFPDDRIEKYFTVLKKLTITIKNKLRADGINIIQNNYSAAGQVIDHMHYHIIPRWKDDGALMLRQSKTKAEPDELEEISKQISG